MKIKYYFSTLLLFVAVNIYAQSFSEKDNVIITAQKNVYEYRLGDKENPVVIKNNSVTHFECTQFRTIFPFSTIYNDMIKIDKVSTGVSGVKPIYRSFEENGIFYSDAKICYFRIPFSKKGETNEVKIQQTYLDPRYFSTIYFTESVSVLEKEVEIVIPTWMNAELKEMNFITNITKSVTFDKKRNANVYLYKMKDMKGIKPESNTPGSSYLYPHILVLNKSADIAAGKQTYFSTLKDQYDWYCGLAKEVNIDEALMKKTAENLTKACSTDKEKITTIFNWVQDNIRYIAFEDGIAGFKPAAPQEVLSKKYGDCKGMAMLTKELLKALGFDARLAWIGTNHIAYDYSTPSLAVDNHMICALFWGEKIYYLDATEEYIGFDEYAERIQGRQVLVENGVNYLLERIPERNAEQNTEIEKSTFQIKNGNLVGKIEKSFKGEEKETFLFSVHSTKNEKLNDALIKYLSQSNEKYPILDLSHSSLNAMADQVSITYTTNTKIGIQQYNQEYYIDLDFRKEFSNSKIDTAKRKQSYLFPHKCHIIHESELTVPPDMKVESLPKELNIIRDGYRFNIKYSQKDGKVIYKKEIAITNTLLPTNRFNEWNQDIAELKKAYLDQIGLAAK